MGKTIYLGPFCLKQETIDFLHKNQGTHLFNIGYKSIESLINDVLDIPSLKDVRSRLETLNLDIYNNAINDDSFINEMIEIKTNLIKYDVDLNSLQKDKNFIKILENIEVKLNLDKLDDDYSNCFILNISYDLFEEKLIDILKKRGAKLFNYVRKDNKSYTYRCLNEAKEYEFVSQYIIENKLNLNDCAIIYSNDTNTTLLENILNLYKIPFSFKNGFNNNAIAFVSLIDFYLDKSINNYLSIIKSNLLVSADINIIEYLNNHLDSSCLFKEFDKFSSDNDYFNNLEENANKTHKLYLPIITKLSSFSSLKDVFDYAYSLLEDSKDKEKIKNIISNYESNELEKSYSEIKERLLNLKTTTKKENALEISDLYHGFYNKDYLFVLDSSIGALPGFKGLSGLLEENDIVNTNYPTAKERKNNLINRLNYLNYSKQTIYIYPEVSYSGKEIVLSSYIKEKNLDSLDFNIKESNVLYSVDHKLDDELIKRVTFNNNLLNGSVSSFETYMKCPYKYFLTYCLGLRNKDKEELAPNTIGNIFHKTLETLINNKHKEYYKYDQKDIESLIEEPFNNLHRHYPHISKQIDLSKESVINTFMLLKEFLEVMENENLYIPTYTEYKVKDIKLAQKDNYSLAINKGSIDRIDEIDGTYRILDYKTKTKTLSSSAVNNGTQLQLLTYSLIYNKLSNKEPGGIFYLTLHPGRVDDKDIYTYNQTNGITQNTDGLKDKYIKEMRMSGRLFNKDAYSSFDTLNTGRSDKTISFSNVLEGLTKVYEAILELFIENDFEIKPTDTESCRYCDYKNICRYRGKAIKREKIYDIL